MKHKSVIPTSSLPKKSCSESKGEKFHPISYYLLGGIDLNGDALDNTAEVEYDNEEEAKELEKEGFSAVPFGDPRLSKFDLVEQYGKHEADAIASKSPTLSDNGGDSVSE